MSCHFCLIGNHLHGIGTQSSYPWALMQGLYWNSCALDSTMSRCVQHGILAMVLLTQKYKVSALGLQCQGANMIQMERLR